MAAYADGENGRGSSRKVFAWAAVIFAAIGVGATAVYAVQSSSTASVLASGLILSCAAAGAGGLLGFLFGVPRVSSGSDGDSGRSGRRYRANTNLEQISDWLTKILVGVGLIQLGQLRHLGGSLLHGIAPALGGTATSEPFGGALLCYFAIFGFLGGWLLTQLYLGRALSYADQALDILRAADKAQQSGADRQAAELREEAIQLLATAGDPTSQYESARRLLPPGRARTDELERIVSTARHEAATGRWNADRVQALFDSGQEGDRITALGLMQGDIAQLGDLERVINAISDSRSAFEQYHALLTAFMMLESLDADQRRRLAEVVQAQRGPGGHIKPDNERNLLAERILRTRR